MALAAFLAVETVDKVGVGAGDVGANGREVKEWDARLRQEGEVAV
jgi:hypothetical protein